MKDFDDLISLIANDREAMDYFKTLPDPVKAQLSKQSSRIHSVKSLRDTAGNLLGK